jgi:medium-chain acyl-[acyl-carrier-protein] hydrolase
MPQLDLENVFIDDYTIRSYEIDSFGKVSVLGICNYLQDIAGNHAARLGVSVEHLFMRKMTWVLSRLHIRVYKYPLYKEEIRIETWPSGVHGRFALRDFQIFDKNNSLIGDATTSWMLIDFNTNKPISMPDFITNIKIPNRNRAIDDPFEKIPVLEEVHMEKNFNVRLSDLDINQHVNNVNYIEWAVETIPLEIWQKYRLSELEISFRAESNYGDRIISQTQHIEKNNKQIFLHRLLRQSDKREVALLKTQWQRES